MVEKNKDRDQILNPVEILATLAGIVITAIGIPITQQPGYTAFLGNALSVMGTMLSSATGAWVISRKQSGDQFKDQIASVQRHLHATVSKMQSAVSEGLDSDVGDEQLALTKIQEQTDVLKIVLADIAGFSGHSLDLQRENMIGIMDEISNLQGVLARAVEVERSEEDEDENQKEALLTELQQKLDKLQQKVEKADISETNKLPGSSRVPKLKTGSVQEMTPYAKCLAAMRRKDMQHLGPTDQLSVLRNIHHILISNRSYRSLGYRSKAKNENALMRV